MNESLFDAMGKQQLEAVAMLVNTSADHHGFRNAMREIPAPAAAFTIGDAATAYLRHMLGKFQNQPVTVPELEHDAMMLRKYGTKVSAEGRLERRIVANLIAHLRRSGFVLQSINDGDDLTAVAECKEAMELIFDLDEASLRFWRGGENGQTPDTTRPSIVPEGHA